MARTVTNVAIYLFYEQNRKRTASPPIRFIVGTSCWQTVLPHQNLWSYVGEDPKPTRQWVKQTKNFYAMDSWLTLSGFGCWRVWWIWYLIIWYLNFIFFGMKDICLGSRTILGVNVVELSFLRSLIIVIISIRAIVFRVSEV